jgi:uncharacterized protein YqeY
MALGSRIAEDLKTALKARDAETTSCLRLVRNALASKEKDLRRPLEEDEEIAVLKSLAKQRGEAARQYRQGGRADLAEGEERELALIEAYLPAQLSPAEINSILDQVFAELRPQSMKDMGAVMKESMARLAGRADGKVVSGLVRERLG